LHGFWGVGVVAMGLPCYYARTVCKVDLITPDYSTG